MTAGLPSMLGGGARKFRADAKGATAVEFAFVLPVFVMLVFSVVEFGQGLKVYNELSSAASRASRLVMLDDNVTNTALETEIRTALDGLVASELHVDLTTDIVSGKNYRVVSITYPHQFAMPFLDAIDLTMSATSRTPESS